MYVLKIVDLFLIVLISTYIGIYKSKVFKKRVFELRQIKNSLEIFKSKIEFTYEPIKDIFLDISKIVYERKENIFENFCKLVDYKDVYIAWNESVEKTFSHLEKEDKDIVLMLGKLLGKTDKTGQINEINMVSNFLDEQILKSEENRKKNEKLYKTLGGVIGLTIAIIFI